MYQAPRLLIPIQRRTGSSLLTKDTKPKSMIEGMTQIRIQREVLFT